MSETQIFRLLVCVLLALLVVVYAAKVGFDIYQWGHKDEVKVLCDTDAGNDSYEEQYRGPADKVLGACQVRHS